MARYTGPKARVNRRLGAVVYESSGAIRAFERRESPPGMHTRRGKVSNYGLGLQEKQKLKHYFGLGERQLRRYFGKAKSMHGNAGENLLFLCERRLDNIVRRAGFTRTRPQARQSVTHCHFRVNDQKVDKPSFLVRAGDIISVRDRPNLKEIYKGWVADNSDLGVVEWLSVDQNGLVATVLSLPTPADFSCPVDIGLVIEFMSR